MKLVYVAGPYTTPDPVANTRKSILLADAMYMESDGELVPVIPHLSLVCDLVAPHSWEHWLAYDFKILSRCDCMLRIPGESPGADAEAEFAEMNGIPVFDSIVAIQVWLREQD